MRQAHETSVEPPESKPGPLPASGADLDFDPDLDMAPVAAPPESPELAAAVAGSDGELRWAGDVRPSDAQAYLQPTVLPAGVRVPTMDMAAVRVRDELDPRNAVTQPARALRSASERPPADAEPDPVHDAGGASSGVADRNAPEHKRRGGRVLLAGVLVGAIALWIARTFFLHGLTAGHDPAVEISAGAAITAAEPSSTVSDGASRTTAAEATPAGVVVTATSVTGAAPAAVDAPPAGTGSAKEPTSTRAAPVPPAPAKPPPRVVRPAPAPTKDPDFW